MRNNFSVRKLRGSFTPRFTFFAGALFLAASRSRKTGHGRVTLKKWIKSVIRALIARRTSEMENGLASWFFPLSWGPTRRRGSCLIKDGSRSMGTNEALSDRKRIPPLRRKKGRREGRGWKKETQRRLPVTRSSRSNGGINVRWKFPAAFYWPVDITRFVKMLLPRANSQFRIGPESDTLR